ncbi:hypothetical protein [Bradyrhizobium sp. SZCCHNR2032]|nr:hypothetical protein [Bradyrhizobium sp. SZCCHNR2032]
MTTFVLIVARQMIIAWVSFAVLPFELMHDAIEGELDRRGIGS